MSGFLELINSAIAAIDRLLAGKRHNPYELPSDDPRLIPLYAAMDKVDRAAMGFTPIRREDSFALYGPRDGYDAFLRMRGITNRSILFDKSVDGGYVWIGEHEAHTGPRRYESDEGPYYEQIVITYYTKSLSVENHYLNETCIFYYGGDAALGRPPVGEGRLTLEDVREVVREWDGMRVGGK